MKLAQLNAFGIRSQVVDCIEGEEPGAPGAGEVRIEMLACPINPAELLIIEGKYANKPPLPARLGIEGAGQVLAVGEAVTGLAPGDLVMSLGRANWAEKLILKAGEVIKAPNGIDVAQLSMLKVNPVTAQLMLTSDVTLAPGDWVIQNAADSAVGVNLIRLAEARGLKTVNVVRRESLIERLQAIGADVVLVDGPDLALWAAAATGGADIKLAIDAAAGAATERLADCLAEEGTVVNYGRRVARPVGPIGPGDRGRVAPGFVAVPGQALEAGLVALDGIERELGIGADREPAVAQFRDPAQRRAALAADPDRNARLLRRLGLEDDIGKAGIVALESRFVAAPELAEDVVVSGIGSDYF